VPIGLFLVVPMVVIWIVGGVVLARRLLSGRGMFGVRQPRPTEFDLAGVHQFSPHDSVLFRGGGMAGGVQATWPFVGLRFDRDWIQVTGVFGRWYARTDVVAVESVTMRGRWSLRIRTTTFDDGFVFVPTSPQQVLAALEADGWPVPQRVR
jgi:hypothetical protein